MSKTILRNKSHIPAKVILEHLPKGYEEMNYLEPAANSLSLILLKNKSIMEVVNTEHPEVACIIKALRDEPKTFAARLKKTRCSEAAFKKALGKTEEELTDYLERAINEMIVRKMSRNEAKKTYLQTAHWTELSSIIKEMANRLEDLFVLQKAVIPSIKAFDDPNTLLYYQLPDELPESEKDIEKIVLISDQINNFMGKAIVTGEVCPLYKRLFKDFKGHKHIKADKTESIWINF
jgi:hypothetical protein